MIYDLRIIDRGHCALVASQTPRGDKLMASRMRVLTWEQLHELAQYAVKIGYTLEYAGIAA